MTAHRSRVIGRDGAVGGHRRRRRTIRLESKESLAKEQALIRKLVAEAKRREAAPRGKRRVVFYRRKGMPLP